MSNSLLERESKMDIPKRFTVTTQDAYNYAASKVFADQQLCMAIKLSGTR
jgi:hypothetical protein